MTSELGHAVHARRHALTASLVQHVLGIQADDDNHAVALDFCLQKAYYHTFLDAPPREVEAYYAQLVARLTEDSQLTKAAALSALSSKLLALPLASPCGTAGLNHSLLQLLACLARRPLSSVLQETPELVALMYAPAVSQHQQHQPASDAARFQRSLQRATAAVVADGAGGDDDSGSEFDPYCGRGGASSSLSSWGDDDSADEGDSDDGEQQQLGQAQQQAPPPPQQAELWHPRGAAADQDQSRPACKPLGLLLGPPQLHPRLVHPPPGCLLPRLADLRAPLAGHHGSGRVGLSSALRPQLGSCYTEAYLAQQVLSVLQGLPAQGFRVADPLAGTAAPAGTSSRCWQQRVEVDPDAATPHMSRSALRALLAEAAAAGSHARQLRALVQQLAAGSAAAAHGIPITPCLRALGVALQAQLDVLGMQLANLQQQAQAQETAQQLSGQPQQRGGLLRVCRQARPTMRRLGLLHGTVFSVLDQLGGSPAAVSAGLIDGLASAAEAATTAHTGAQGAGEASSVLHLLLSACVPLVGALAHWLWGGGDPQQQAAGGSSSSSSVCCPDFFITRQSAVAATDPSFWHTAYALTTTQGAAAGPGSGSSDVCCPAFLQPLVGAIVSAGKGMRLLQHMEQEEAKSSRLHGSSCSNSRQQQQQQHQQPQSRQLPPVVADATASSLQRAASGSWPRRPCSAGAAGGQLSGSTSTRSSQAGHRRSSSAGGAVPTAAAGSGGAAGTSPAVRRQWALPAQEQRQQPLQASAPAADVARQVRLQLAAAAVVAGRHEQDVLPAEFVTSACAVLRLEQQMLARAPQQQQGSTGEHAGAGDVLAARLMAAGAMLARASVTADKTQQQQQQPIAVGLREALAAAKAERLAAKPGGQQAAGGASRAQPQRCDAGAASGATADDTTSTPAGGAAAEPVACKAAAAAASAEAASADAAGDIGGASSSSSGAGSPDVPRLMAWRDQLEGRLVDAGQQLRHMAPWASLPPGGSKARDAAAAAAAASGLRTRGKHSTLLLAGAVQVPGRFTGSLAELWPLKPLAALVGREQECDADSSTSMPSLLRTGSWPGRQLAWLLHSPPQQLPALQLLLNVALLQPLKCQIEAIDRQVLSCLMGEWGMLQSLQGMVGAFVTASPRMVEWLDAAFDAVEAAAAAAAAHSPAASASRSGSAAVATAGPLEGDSLTDLQALLQSLIDSTSDSDEALPDSSSLHVIVDAPAAAQQQGAGGASSSSMRLSSLTHSIGGWEGLQLQHSGSWQLSLVFSPEQLHSFNHAWRFMVQLRWVARRVASARHAACKGSAAAARAAARDRDEAAAVAAAHASGRAAAGGRGAAAVVQQQWLSARQELLLLQEMGSVFACWQAFIMERLVFGAWDTLQQVLLSATTLEQVQAAAGAFLAVVLDTCGARARVPGSARKGWWSGATKMLLHSMDAALRAAAATEQLQAARTALQHGGRADAAAHWLQLGAARRALFEAAGAWHTDIGYLLGTLAQLVKSDQAQALLTALDQNGWLLRQAKLRTKAHVQG